MPLIDKDARLKYQREYHKRRLAEDPEYRARAQQQRRTWMAKNREKMNEHQRAFRRRQGQAYYRDVLRPRLYDGYRPPGDSCESCGRHFDTARKEPHLDHDHDTNKFRGWLCSGCNVSLGMMHEDPVAIRKLAEYADACL